MGGSGSKEQKKTESQGQVTNTVTVENISDFTSNELSLMIAIICVVKILELTLYIYNKFVRNLKKKYQNTPLTTVSSTTP